MDREVWSATVHGVVELNTTKQLNWIDPKQQTKYLSTGKWTNCDLFMQGTTHQKKKKNIADTNNWTTDVVEYPKNANQNLESTKNILFDSIDIKM